LSFSQLPAINAKSRKSILQMLFIFITRDYRLKNPGKLKKQMFDYPHCSATIRHLKAGVIFA